MRPNNRALDQLREVSFEPGANAYAEGSCLVKFGLIWKNWASVKLLSIAMSCRPMAARAQRQFPAVGLLFGSRAKNSSQQAS